MSRYRVTVTDTYAANATTPYSSQRRVQNVAAGRCVSPVTVAANGHTRAIACGRRLPAERQCAGCRNHIEVIEVRRVRQ